MRHSFIFTGIAALVASLILTTGCKEDTVVKADVVPGDNDLGTETLADTMTVITKNVLLDRLKTSEKVTNFPVVQALGSITDEFFGKTHAGLYFQVLPPANEFAFSAGGYTIDSAVLILPYSGFSWGNRTDPKPQSFKVYQLTEDMSIDAEYYSDQQVGTGKLLADVIIDMRSAITDTPQLAADSAGFKHIRIPLSQEYIDDVKNNIGNYGDDPSFLSYFKGFYVVPDSTANNNAGTDLLTYILFDGGGDYSRVAVAFYYREDGSNESQVKFFNYNRDKTANFNRIKRTYNGFPAYQFIERSKNFVDASHDTLILQNEPGMAIDVRIPHIEELPTAAILKAELVFTQISSGTASDSLQVPNRLTIVGIDSDGVEYQINDFNANDGNAAVAFVDGQKRDEKDANGNDIVTYRINIPRELQKAINDKRNELHLRIKGARSFPAAYRLVAGGRGHSTYNTQLNIVYSKPK